MNVDQRHLAAMGLPVTVPGSESPAPPVSFRRAIHDRATTLQVDTLWNTVTPAGYLNRHNRMRSAGRRRFTAARCQHKLMQEWQNTLAKRYVAGVRALHPDAPNAEWNPEGHLRWLPGFLANGDTPLLERERLAGLAEETAVWAVEQGEKHHRLLKKWKWGYNSLYSRQQHERYAQQALDAAAD
ncbi:hypothetical protein ACHAPJ_009990 [Fusarium lateritium]